MAIVDNWDSQEGYICNGAVIDFVTLETACVAGEPLAFGTAASNKIVMKLHANAADSSAVALKGGVTGDVVPAVFYGVVKMVAYSVCTVGGFVTNSKTAGTTITYGNVHPLTAQTPGQNVLARICGTGTAFLLGQCLQAGTTVGDELLVLIGSGH